MTAPALEASVFRFRFRNPTGSGLTLWSEPRGDQVTIPERTTVEVRCTEQLGPPSELEMSEDGLTVRGWVQGVFAVAEDSGLQPLWSLPQE